MSGTPEQRLEELERQLDTLRAERDRLNEEALKWAGKRDLLHEKTKKLRLEARSFRDDRDELNAAVHQLKTLREEVRTERLAKIDQLKTLRKEAKEASSYRPSRSSQSLENEIAAIEWKIQTASPSLDEERRLVEQVKALETQMSVYRKVQAMKEKIAKLQSEATALKEEAASYNEKISEMAEQSQRYHEKMIDRLENARKLNAEADNMHRRFVELKEEERALHMKYSEASEKAKALRDRARQEEEE
ncbi:MAG: hypothetical protein NWE76_04620, partial [Candidatus Bathyarchaeota archaeon]|nr:hypothetical protein [Candidatus Bathyarchaeota archaeon]